MDGEINSLQARPPVTLFIREWRPTAKSHSAEHAVRTSQWDIQVAVVFVRGADERSSWWNVNGRQCFGACDEPYLLYTHQLRKRL